MATSTIAQTARHIRRGWWLLCNEHATNIRGDWARYEAEWERDTRPGFPMGKTDQQRRDFALAWADFLEALGGSEPRV